MKLLFDIVCSIFILLIFIGLLAACIGLVIAILEIDVEDVKKRYIIPDDAIKASAKSMTIVALAAEKDADINDRYIYLEKTTFNHHIGMFVTSHEEKIYPSNFIERYKWRKWFKKYKKEQHDANYEKHLQDFYDFFQQEYLSKH